MSEQTLGQKRVKAEFNPAKDGTVDHLKNQSANLIDLLEEIKSGPDMISGEQARVISLAQTHIETACMYGVKACFTK